jgi:hypothetical protein
MFINAEANKPYWWVVSIELVCSKTDIFIVKKNTNQVKNKKYHTVGTVPKSSRKIEETVANSVK